jgi:hypothetical protein
MGESTLVPVGKFDGPPIGRGAAGSVIDAFQRVCLSPAQAPGVNGFYDRDARVANVVQVANVTYLDAGIRAA